MDYITPGIKMLAGAMTPEKREAAIELEKREAALELQKRGFRTSGQHRFSGPIIVEPYQGNAHELFASSDPLAHCDIAATPQCIAALYNITTNTKNVPGNDIGIFEEGDYYRAEDLAYFVST